MRCEKRVVLPGVFFAPRIQSRRRCERRVRRESPMAGRAKILDRFIDNFSSLRGISNINQLAEPPGPDAFSNSCDQLWKRSQISDRRRAEPRGLGEAGANRIDIIL